MKFRNPARHYPSYLVHIYLKDGRQLNVRGTAAPEIDLPFDEGNVLAIVVKILDASRDVKFTQLLVDGEWSDYSNEALEDVLSPPMTMPKPKPEPKPEPKQKVKRMPKPKVGPYKPRLEPKVGPYGSRLEPKGVDKE